MSIQKTIKTFFNKQNVLEELSFSIEIAKVIIKLSFNDQQLGLMARKYLRHFIVDSQVEISFNFFIKLIKDYQPSVDELTDLENSNCDDCVFGKHWFSFINYSQKKILGLINELSEEWLFALLCGIYAKIFNYRTKNRLWCHACAISNLHNAYIFIGPSGSGKTTIATRSIQCGSYKILSDEAVVIDLSSEISAYGTPFSSEIKNPIGCNYSAKLKAIFFINKGEEIILKKIKPAHAMINIIRSNTFMDVKNFIISGYNEWSRLVTKIPCYSLTLNLTDDFWEVIKNEKI